MAFVIAEPCIGTKDTACVDACPVDCIHPKKDTAYNDGRPIFDEVPQLYIDPLIPWSASTVALACLCAQCRRFLPWMTCPRSGNTTPKSTPAMSRAANSPLRSCQNPTMK